MMHYVKQSPLKTESGECSFFKPLGMDLCSEIYKAILKTVCLSPLYHTLRMENTSHI